jgi:hypothetical protein
LDAGPATIGELAPPFGLTLNGMKKHVGILEEVDLVVTAKVRAEVDFPSGPRTRPESPAFLAVAYFSGDREVEPSIAVESATWSPRG